MFLPSVVIIEVSAVLSKILRKEIAKDGIDKLLLTAEEIYPITLDMLLNSIYARWNGPININLHTNEKCSLNHE